MIKEQAKPIRAIIVDDSAVARRTISSLLEGDDSVTVIGSAENGREALEQVEALQPDLVLMDVQMPVMDGLDATAELRKSHPDTRVIMVTLYDEPEVRKKCRDNGADGFVAKSRLHRDLPTEIDRIFPESP